MAIDDKVRDEKLQYDINNKNICIIIRKKNDKCEYLTGEEILPPDQKAVIEQARFAYSPLGKAFEKQIKIIEH